MTTLAQIKVLTHILAEGSDSPLSREVSTFLFLRRRGLIVASDIHRGVQRYTITAAGRQALAEANRKE